MTLAVYMSHPQVVIDPAIAVPQWTLSERGRERLWSIRDASWVASIGDIVSSLETKAVDTAVMLSHAADARVRVLPGLHENDRTATGFLPPAEFEGVADAFFARPDESVRGWERAVDAQKRVVDIATGVVAEHAKSGSAERTIAFSGHGGVGTLLLCHVAGRPISRIHDQPGGGGNVFAFKTDKTAMTGNTLLFSWTPLEHVQATIDRLRAEGAWPGPPT